jgi:hypothetical protein
MKWWFGLAAMAVSSPLAAYAQCVVQDDFNDGTPAGIWTHATSPGSSVQVAESYGRINFAGTVNYGTYDLGFGWSTGWELDMTQNWALSATWNCNAPAPAGYYGEVGLAIGVMLDVDPELPSLRYGMTMSTGLYHEIYDGWVYDFRYQVLNRWTNDAYTEVVGDYYYDELSGTTYIWYDAYTNRLYVDNQLYGANPWVLTNFRGGGSWETTATIGYGVYSWGTVSSFNWNQMYGDNFCLIDGAVVGPAVGACCAGGTCVETIESSCDGQWMGEGSSCEASCSSCVGDVDCSGAVDAGDITAMLDDWGAPSACRAAMDLDGSGVIGVLDLLLLLQAWGPCGG